MPPIVDSAENDGLTVISSKMKSLFLSEKNSNTREENVQNWFNDQTQIKIF